MNINLSNYKTKPLVVFVALISSLISWLLSKVWDCGFAQGISPISVIIGLLYLYDKWLWKLPILRFLVKVPNISGSYSGKVEYYFNGQESFKDCNLTVQQTASSIKIKCDFDKEGESSTSSESKEALITQDALENYSLLFYYQNKGSRKSGDNLNQHDGFNRLDINLSDSKEIVLNGEYFTNRKPQTMGRMKVTKIEKKEK